MRIFSTLVDIAQYQRTMSSLMIRSAVHEVERNSQGVDIRVIRVVNQCTTVLSLLHLQSHGHRLQLRHPLSQLLDGHTQLQGSNGTGNGIVDRSLIDERNLV